MIRAVRGAITVERDEPDIILEATEELLRAVAEANHIREDAAVSILFTLTPDLSSTFPAAAARRMGWTDTPLMCANEIPVPGALERCIRLLMHFDTKLPKSDVRHIYLEDAISLRPDLAEGGNLR